MDKVIQPRGFGLMSPERRREVAVKGGKAAKDSPRVHRWNHDEAVAASKKSHELRRQRKAAP